MGIRPAGIVVLLGLVFGACARDEEAAIRAAAREYLAALAAGRHDLLFDLTTEETRNFFEELRDGFREPERFAEIFSPGTFERTVERICPGLPERDASSLSARELFVKHSQGSEYRPTAAMAAEALGEEPVLEVDPRIDFAVARWIRSGRTAFIVWQRGAWRVEEVHAWSWLGTPVRHVVPGPFGRRIAGYQERGWREPPPLAVRLPRWPGDPRSERERPCRIWVDAAATVAIGKEPVRDLWDLRDRLHDAAEPHREPEWPHTSRIPVRLHADRRLRWRAALELLFFLADPQVDFRYLFVRTAPEEMGPGRYPFGTAEIPFELDNVYLLTRVLRLDALVELTVDREDLATGRLARLPAVWAAVPEERKVRGLRLVLDDLSFEQALIVLVATNALAPERIVLGERAEVGRGRGDSTIPPLELRLATAPRTDPPASPPPRWPIGLTIHVGSREPR